MKFSQPLIERYITYVRRKSGQTIELEQAERELQTLAELHAVFSSTHSMEVLPASARTLAEGRAQEDDRRED